MGNESGVTPIASNLTPINNANLPYFIMVGYEVMEEEDFDINLLESIIGVDKESFISKVQKKNKKLEKFSPVTIKRFIEFEKKIMIEERIEDFPGILFSTIPARKYVSRVNLSHALGYLGLVDKEKKIVLNDEDSLYQYSI